MRVIGSSPATVGGGRRQRRSAPSENGFSGVLHDDTQAVFPALAKLADAGPCPEEAR
jgi:hypothetical protein